MASIAFYNHTRKLFASNEVDLSTLRVMLLNGHTFEADDVNVKGLTEDEVSGNGWEVGGESVGSAAVTITDTNGAKLDGNDVSVIATGGSIGPADGGAIVADDFSDIPRPLFYLDFGGAKIASIDTPFQIAWNASGIARWMAP